MAIADLRPVTRPAPAPGRDTGIDLVRALCVLGVVVLHALMVGVTVTDAGPAFVNASEGSVWITPLSWILQVMPLFFVIGGFAGYTSYLRARQRGSTAKDFAAARIHRLLRPAICTIAIVGIALIALLLYGVPEELVAIAGYRFGQPLWFLGVFLLCQVLLPVLARAHEHAPWRSIGLLAAGAIAVDAIRAVTGIEAIGILNLALVWLTLQQLGFFLADGRITGLARRTRKNIGLAALAVLLLGVAVGAYSPDLIENINPPTTALLLVGVAHTMLMSLMRERLDGWSRSAFGTRLRGFVTPRAMTIYLWHMPVLLAMAGASVVFAVSTGVVLPDPSSAAWWMTRPLWLVTVFALTAGVARALARIEARPAPAATRSTARLVSAAALGIAAVVGLLAFPVTPVTAALAVAVMVVALRLAGAPHRGSRRDADQGAAFPSGSPLPGSLLSGPSSTPDRPRSCVAECGDPRDGLGDDLRARAEVQSHVTGAFGTERRAEVQRDPGLAENALGGVVAPAQRCEIDPGEIAGIRNPETCGWQLLGEQVGEETAVLIQRRQQTVQPRVALA